MTSLNLKSDLLRQLSLAKVNAKDVTHSGGRGEAFHDWFPYLEGYSSQFVKEVLNEVFVEPKMLLEPFGGVGTTPVVLAQMGIGCGYTEVNPFLVELVTLKSKTMGLTSDERDALDSDIDELISDVGENLDGQIGNQTLRSNFFAVFGDVEYFPTDNFQTIYQLKSYENGIENNILRQVFRAAVSTSLLQCSLLRRAGDVRFKTEKELQKGTPSIAKISLEKLKKIQSDIRNFDAERFVNFHCIGTNAKDLGKGTEAGYDGVITSPPYLNGTNYIRNMKLELWYLGYLKTKADLKEFRSAVVTSAINDVSGETGRIVIDEAKDIVEQVAQSCYDSRIPKMIAGYLAQMKTVANGILYCTKPGSPVCIDIGDSVYGGIHVPTHDLLRDIFIGVGFTFEDEVILRKRHSNRGAELSQRMLVFRKRL